MRVFAAVVPPLPVLDHLDRALRAVVGLGTAGDLASPLRWAARETWHLTLAFYGDLPDGAVPELCAELDAVAASVSPFALWLRGAGFFAGRTLWIGAGGDLAVMTALTVGAVGAGAEVGAWPDDRVRSRPHLTVGRVARDRLTNGRPTSGRPTNGRPTNGRPTSGRSAGRGGAGDRGVDPARRPPSGSRGPRAVESLPDAVVRALAVYEGPSWTVDEVVLLESVPGAGAGGGPLYTPVQVCALGGRPEAPR